MPFRKGQPRPANAGRRPGSANKVTRDFRESLARLLNASNLDEMFADVPSEKRLELLGKLAEYVMPKLERTELTGADGKELKASVTIVYPKDGGE